MKRIVLGPRGRFRFTPEYVAKMGGPIVGMPATTKAEQIEHAEELARGTGKPWVVYHNPFTGSYGVYSVSNLSRLKRNPHLAELPSGRIVHLARGKKYSKTSRSR